MVTRRGAVPFFVLLLAGTAAADGPAAPASAGSAGAAPAPSRLRLLPPEHFRLFPQLAPEPHLGLSGTVEERLFHQPGDPDSTFTLGKPSPGGEVHVLAVIDVNEIHLKAIPPDPLIQSGDTRVRAAGSFFPVDGQGRPYQLRLGARLVW